MLDSVSSLRSKPVLVHALDATIAALQTHISNGLIWPDFSRTPSPQGPFVRYLALSQDEVVNEGTLIKILQLSIQCQLWVMPCWGKKAGGGLAEIQNGNRHFGTGLSSLPNSHLPASCHAGHRNCFQQPPGRLSLPKPPSSASVFGSRVVLCNSCGAQYPIYITHSKPAEANLILREIGGMGICREIRPLVAGDLHEV